MHRLQNRCDFLRISGEQGRRRGKRKASVKRELRVRGGSFKNPTCLHTIVQGVPAFKYERSYLIGNTITYSDLIQQQIDSR